LNPYLEAWKKQGMDKAPSAPITPIPSDGAISSGSVFLDPAVVKDATIIQRRLFDLGFYKMKVDGSFGEGSRRSLGAFKKANELANNSVWDLKTQKALFKGSGL